VERERSSRVRVAGRTALAIASLVLSLLIAEAVLRLVLHGSILPLTARSTAGRVRDPHPVLGWVGRPNVDVWRRQLDYLVRIRTSSRGFRDVEHALEKPTNVKRVVVLGDSFMEATQTSLETSFSRVLEAKLGPGFEVINLGMSGYGTLQERLLLEEIGLAYDPDVVLLAFFNGNDVRDNSWELEKRLWENPGPLVASRPYARIDPVTGSLAITPPEVRHVAEAAKPESAPSFDPLRHMMLGRLAVLGAREVRDAWRAWWNGRPPGPDPNLALGWPFLAEPVETGRRRAAPAAEVERLWDDAWNTTARLILETRDLAVGHGARFVLVSIPSRLQADESVRESLQERWPAIRFDETRLNRLLAKLAAQNEIDFVDLLPAFAATTRSSESPPLYYTREDEHWTPAGHALAADLVARRVAR